MSRTKSQAEKEYHRFVTWGIGKETICNAVKGQAILGEDDFFGRLAGHLKQYKEISEIPKSQRYANRPSLEKPFSQGVLLNKRKRNKKIA